MNKHVIIVAGGVGSRMKSDMPKQFMLLNRKPILLYSIEAFYEYDPEINVIVVLPSSQIEYWKEMIINYDISIKHEIVAGGKERFYSVKKALSHIEGGGLVAVHDGVRPLPTRKIIADSFDGAEMDTNAIAAVDMKDSIRKLTAIANHSVDRSLYKVIQTPQTFDVVLLKQAYKQSYSREFTDDASVVEQLGEQIYLTEGSYRNIKITTPEDLLIAESLLKNSDLD